MCYSRAPRCTKHGAKGEMHTEWQGNKYIAKCTEPGCTEGFTWVQVVTKDQQGHESISYKSI